jgi:hypothetical protein
MEINALTKYIVLNKMVNGTVEVLFAGQPCLTIHESGVNGNKTSNWRINPVFAKLVYGANIFEDIPMCDESFETTEEAIAGGLVKLHELGAFNTQYDHPEDTYAATMNVVAEDVKRYVRANSKSITEATREYDKIMESIVNHTFESKTDRSEKSANDGLAGVVSPVKKIEKPTPKHKLIGASGTTLSSHDTEGDAMRAYKNLANQRGVKIVKESEDGVDVDITPVQEKVSIFTKWKNLDKDGE